MLKQRTIKKSVKARGVGIHSGKQVNMTLIPASSDHGVVFRRLDAGGRQVHAHSAFVNEVVLSTGLESQGVKVPIMDGSSAPFIFLVQSAGIEEQDAPKRFIVIKNTVRVENGESWAQVSPHNGFKVTLEIDFEHQKIKESGQKLTIDFAKQSYLKEISRARTFGYERDVEDLQADGLALGASFDNAIALSDDSILNEDGMRYHNEFVKHKILDIVGDLFLLGGNMVGHYEGYKTGHMLNDQLLSAILSQPKAFTIEVFEEVESPIHYYSEDWQNQI